MTSCYQPPGSYCHQQTPTSGQMFDWWRCCNDGCFVTRPPPPPLPKLKRMPPLRKSELCWPHPKRQEQVEDSTECEVSRDFWPDPWDSTHKRPKLKHQRPPWKPAMFPNQWGIVKYPPPYTRYCRDRVKPLPFICKP